MLNEKGDKPVPPTSLRAAGKKVWVRMWESPFVNPIDYETVNLLCELIDEKKELMTYIKSKERVLSINGDTNFMLNPAIKRLDEVQKHLTSLFIQFGMTPASRSKMQENLNKEEDAVDKLLRKWEEDKNAK